jgi:hypothetical protein
MRLFTRVLPLMLLASLLSGCGYNAIQQKDEAVKASWSECSTSTSAAPIWCPTWCRR